MLTTTASAHIEPRATQTRTRPRRMVAPATRQRGTRRSPLEMEADAAIRLAEIAGLIEPAPAVRTSRVKYVSIDRVEHRIGVGGEDHVIDLLHQVEQGAQPWLALPYRGGIVELDYDIGSAPTCREELEMRADASKATAQSQPAEPDTNRAKMARDAVDAWLLRRGLIRGGALVALRDLTAAQLAERNDLLVAAAQIIARRAP